MTKLRWDKADEYVPDPGAVVEVEEPIRPERWTPPQERQRKKEERARRDRERRERSEKHDLDLFIAGQLRRIRAKEDRGEPLSAWDKLVLDREMKSSL
jgi:hypothetical protein